MKNLFLLLLCVFCTPSLLLSQWNENTYDFWLGKWNLTWDQADGSKGTGTNHIEKILDGKVIQEHFEAIKGTLTGFKGTSISVFNPQNNEWHQAWADNQGSYYDFYGEEEGDKKIFSTHPQQINDTVNLVQRMIFYDITENSLMWDWESSKNGGKTWALNWRIAYERVE